MVMKMVMLIFNQALELEPIALLSLFSLVQFGYFYVTNERCRSKLLLTGTIASNFVIPPRQYPTVVTNYV